MAFPTSPTKGQTHTEYGEVYFFNGISWSKGVAKTLPFGDCIFDSAEPTNPFEGLHFFNYTNNELKKYESGSWTLVANV